jgi:hypothetical protein
MQPPGSSLHRLSELIAVFSAKIQNPARHNKPKNRQTTKKGSKKNVKIFYSSSNCGSWVSVGTFFES